ncbi:response regulator [candidate division WOR-3 bacterium]|nr:response regulator [candidate division WOR-3 bacterium]
MAPILIVDDEIAFTTVVSKMLASQGYVAEVANSGKKALSMLESKEYDLVITDLNMPGMDGLELIRKIRESLGNQRIIVVTGYPSQDSHSDAVKLGVLNYIVKPFVPDQFIEILNQAIAN